MSIQDIFTVDWSSDPVEYSTTSVYKLLTEDYGNVTTAEPEMGADAGGSGDGLTPSCKLYKFFVAFIMLGSLCVFGVVGNGLSQLVMWPDRNKSATNLLLIVLAFVDDLVLLSRFVMRSLPALCDYTGACSPHYYLVNRTYLSAHGWAIASLAHLATTYITLQVTIHRYIVVCWPHKSSTLGTVRVARLQAASALVFAFIFNLPRHFRYVIIADEDGDLVRKSTAMNKSESYQVVYQLAFYYIVIYIVPLSILVILTHLLVRAVKAARERREQMTSKTQDREDITVTLVAVVVVFVVCQLFNPIRRVLAVLLTEEQQTCGHFYFYYAEVNSFAISVNSAINFLLYCLFGKRFRKNLKVMLFRRNRVGFIEAQGTVDHNSTAVSNIPPPVPSQSHA